MKNLKRLTIVAVAVLSLLALIAVVYDNRVSRVALEDQNALKSYVKSNGLQASLWSGTYYCGDKGGWSCFRHKVKILPDVELEIPAESWHESRRFEYQKASRKWRRWSELDMNRDEGR